MRPPEESEPHPKERLNSRSMAKDQRPGQKAPMIHTERRKSPRTSIRKPAYINFEPYNNGGVITEISATGLRFHTVDPVEQGGVVRLSILLGAGKQIEAVGELMWKDSTRRVGGLRFTVLPAGAADQIRNWAEALNSADTLKSGTSRPSGTIHDPSIPNQASSQPEAAATTDGGVAETVANLSGPPQATPTQAGPEASARSARVPPSARPPAGAATTQTCSPDLPNPRTLLPRPAVGPGGYQQPSTMPWITHFDPDPPARAG